jgi:hypothetical protein
MGPVLRGVLEECMREKPKAVAGFELSEGDKAGFVEEREVALREVNEATAAALKEADGVKGVKGVFQVAGDVRARELAEREVGMAWSFVKNARVLAEREETVETVSPVPTHPTEVGC